MPGRAEGGVKELDVGGTAPPSVGFADISPTGGEIGRQPASGCARVIDPSSSAETLRSFLNCSFALPNDSSASLSAKISFSPGCGPKSFSAAVTSKRPYSIRGEKLTARLPGMVQGVVVQITTDAPTMSSGDEYFLSRPSI